MGVKVYWAARDLDSFFWGNHHFILIMFDKKSENPTRYDAQGDKGGPFFVTLAAFKEEDKNNRLMFRANDSSDVRSVQEVLNPKKYATRSWDYDMEQNRIKSPSGSDSSFAQKLEQLSRNYERNEAKSNVTYALLNENCAAWVNTLLKVAGVSAATRLKQGEFSGFDWGEEDKVPESLFK